MKHTLSLRGWDVFVCMDNYCRWLKMTHCYLFVVNITLWFEFGHLDRRQPPKIADFSTPDDLECMCKQIVWHLCIAFDKMQLITAEARQLHRVHLVPNHLGALDSSALKQIMWKLSLQKSLQQQHLRKYECCINTIAYLITRSNCWWSSTALFPWTVLANSRHSVSLASRCFNVRITAGKLFRASAILFSKMQLTHVFKTSKRRAVLFTIGRPSEMLCKCGPIGTIRGANRIVWKLLVSMLFFEMPSLMIDCTNSPFNKFIDGWWIREYEPSGGRNTFCV